MGTHTLNNALKLAFSVTDRVLFRSISISTVQSRQPIVHFSSWSAFLTALSLAKSVMDTYKEGTSARDVSFRRQHNL